ncbi:tyrosine--tRNA ligase [Candidatus Woesearchaeota archaeon]|nr:MAG: tyrosine--tRNA ligase [Candidatus Woesearchaeota archaeon]
MEVLDIMKYVKDMPTEEILTESLLETYISERKRIKHYIGFEISGYVHLGTGLICMEKIADFQKAGFDTTIFLADYHSWINKKLGGDLSLIRKVAGGYFKEALRQSLKIVGGDPDKVKFVLGSELYDQTDYLENVIKVSMHTNLSRVKRSVTIMGRKTGESLDFAQLLYVPMQVADIFTLGVNLAHGGMDQRKAHVIAIDLGKAFNYKPVALHHHLLIGMHITEDIRKKILDAKKRRNRELFEEGIIEIKMSKSKPKTAIFIHASADEIQKKIKKAYCPMGEIELNPVLELAKYIVFKNIKEPLEILNHRNNTTRLFNTYSELERAYLKQEIHPFDLKMAIAKAVTSILEPIRRYFHEGNGRKYLEEMKDIIQLDKRRC